MTDERVTHDAELDAVLAALDAGQAFAVLTPAPDEWGWRPQHANFFLDPEQADTWARREHGVLVGLPIIADYRETTT